MRRKPSITNAVTAALMVATGTTLAAAFDASAQAHSAQKVAVAAQAEAAAWRAVATSGGTTVSQAAISAAVKKATSPATQLVSASATTRTS